MAQNNLYHHLRHSISHCRNPQHPFSASLLRYCYRFDRRGKVTAGRHPIPDFVEIILQIPLKIRYDSLSTPAAPWFAFTCSHASTTTFLEISNGFVLSTGSSHLWLTSESGWITRPLRSTPITDLHHYYGAFRPCAPHRYSHPCGSSTWISPLTSERQVPTLHIKPGSSSRRLHAGHRPDSKQVSSRLIPGQCNPPVLTTPICFRHVISGSVLFVSLSLT